MFTIPDVRLEESSRTVAGRQMVTITTQPLFTVQINKLPGGENFSILIEYGNLGENFNQSEARKHCFLASDWLKFETLQENTAGTLLCLLLLFLFLVPIFNISIGFKVGRKIP